MAEIPNNQCSGCSGTGEIDGLFHHVCLGTGEISTGVVRAFLKHFYDDIALQPNVFDSYVVLEELDATEHAALTDPQKDGVLHLLACGKIDLNDDKAGKTRLWNWFGAESTTVANLTELLT